MDVIQLINIIRKNRKIVIACLLLGGVLAGGFAFFYGKSRYRATALLFVTRPTQAESGEYFGYDGINAQQTAFHYTDTLVGLARELSASIVKREGEQLVLVGIEGKDVSDSELDELLSSLTKAFSQATRLGDDRVKVFELDGFRRRERLEMSFPLVVIAGFLVGLGGGIIFVSLKEYLKR